MKPGSNKLLQYPGGEIVEKGLNDIREHRYQSFEALALMIASNRLSALGFQIRNDIIDNPHLQLYSELSTKFDNAAHYQFNALMQRLDKFCRYYESHIAENT